MKLKLNRKRIQQIGAISFTDVVFLLLIFFLLSSSFVIQTGLKVDLQSEKTGHAYAAGNHRYAHARWPRFYQ